MQFIPYARAGPPDRPHREFEDGDSAPGREDDAKWPQRFDHFDDSGILIHEDDVNGKTHPYGVNRVTPRDQQTVFGRQRSSPEKPHEPSDEPIGYLDM